MGYESEAQLEERFIKQLVSEGYERVNLKHESDLKNNFRMQIELFNKTYYDELNLNDIEFEILYDMLTNKTSFLKSLLLRDIVELSCDDGTVKYVYLMHKSDWCKNIFQVTNQVQVTREHVNRYDVTLLVNGIPVIQIELKRSSVDIREAFHQTIRYQKETINKPGLMGFTQIFVISNGSKTLYYANKDGISINYVSTWCDTNNNKINDLETFTKQFLSKCFITKLIVKYMVLNEKNSDIKVLRPYQIHACDIVLDHVKNTTSNGFVWHTTGSGKTLTSYTICNHLSNDKDVSKVLFIVDRSDLNTQTLSEFKNFGGDIEDVNNTKDLIAQLENNKSDIIITTIQKLNKAVEKFKSKNLTFDERVILIFDECHRSQFGSMHSKVINYFTNNQCIGFTGTPIFAQNSNGDNTTSEIFNKELHSYKMKDAIADKSVLDFTCEYYSTMKPRNIEDRQVEAINTQEIILSSERTKLVCDDILASLPIKTDNYRYSAMITVQKIDQLINYYNYLKPVLENEGKTIAALFTVDPTEGENKVSHKTALKTIIDDYNKQWTPSTNWSSDNVGDYRDDIITQTRANKINVILVVSMFLTGFDAPQLNTLYVDRNLEYHSLIQAMSRTNRIFESKDSGQVVFFDQAMKDKVDSAVKLFNGEENLNAIIRPEYIEVLEKVRENVKQLLLNFNDANSVYNIKSEELQKNFILEFREVLRGHNKIKTYTDYKFSDLGISEKQFAEFSGAYESMYEKKSKTKETTLDSIDFELQLIATDKINYDYIINLLGTLNTDKSTFERDKEQVIKDIEKSDLSKSKKELIIAFIHSQLSSTNFIEDFEEYKSTYYKQELQNLKDKFNLNTEIFNEVVSDFEYSGKIEKEELRKALGNSVPFKDRRSVLEEITGSIVSISEAVG